MAQPRINSSMFSKYQNRNVRIVGRTIGIQGSEALMETSDKGQVTVHLSLVYYSFYNLYNILK